MKLFEQFQGAVESGDDRAIIPSLKTNPRLSAQAQMKIYIEGYRARLIAAIRSDYPALLFHLGEENFDMLALAYIKQNPPRHFNLDRYPHPFAAFVAAHTQDAFARDIAKLEGAIAEVFMDEESAALSPQSLAHYSPEDFATLILKPRTASRLLAFDYPVSVWLDAERAGKKPPAPDGEKTWLYIYRHQHNIQRAPLSANAFQLLEKLCGGLPVGEALADNAAAQVQQWFGEWLSAGFFAAA